MPVRKSPVSSGKLFLLLSIKKFLQLKVFFFLQPIIEEEVDKGRPWSKFDNHSYVCEVIKYMQVTHILLVGTHSI